MTEPHVHASHPKIASRLKRAEGDLRAVVTMIEEEWPCLDVAQHLRAVERVVRNAKPASIHDHMDHCLDGDLADDRDELKAIARYL